MRKRRWSGRRLREFRKRAGLSRDELAQQAGIAYQTLCLLEQGKQAPLFLNGVRLAQVLKVPPEALLEDDVEAASR